MSSVCYTTYFNVYALMIRMNGLVIFFFSFSFEAITIFCKKITHMKNLFSSLFMVFAATGLFAQNVNNNANSNHGNKFEQMGANFPHSE